MATNKTYTVAGTSASNGKTKVRFAQDYVSRFKILNKNGHTDIELIELGSAMSKADICKMLMGHEKFQSEAQQSAISEFVVRNIKKSDTAPVSTPAVETTETVSEVETA
jgi:hypothetical protein|tara:strand:- start:54 stop:380 length:327 start_codon:yes stop_codon:yes gene_type:complete